VARASSGTATLATPVLSLRRVPAFLSATVADGHLSADLDRALDDPALGAGRQRECLSVREATGRVAFARNPDMALTPASTMKLFTATAALARLGTDFHYRTEITAAAAPAQGVVAGDVWLVGSGDPLLATGDFAAVAGYQGHPRASTPLESLADRFVSSGVHEIRGRVVGDESRYDTQRYVSTWSPTYITNAEIGPMSALTVNDGFAPFRPTAVPVPAPATNAAGMLTALLRARGVKVGGEAGEGRSPTGAPVVAAIDSAPLPDVVGTMLKESDNLAAELLVKELGVRFGGSGTTAAGVGVMRSTMTTLGLTEPGLASVDGSGLDRSDRLTCSLLQAVLSRSGEEGTLGRDLPVAGKDGTLARRFLGTPAAGKVRAKTGSLEGVNGLSGWTTAADGRSLQFALLANDLPRGVGGALEDRVVSALATYPQAPPAGELGPQAPVLAAPPG
jgi:D-alanyl-D-alanine carboxypeptidase/D-alanyl-D-alanine-endopeptidase (penicillin-binding protein 4)